MKKMGNRAVWVLLAVFLLAGCAPFRNLLGIKTSWADMTPKQKSVVMVQFWAEEYASYPKTLPPNLTDDQKQVLRIKKQVLGQSKPMLDAYCQYVDLGVIPPDSMLKDITELLKKIGWKGDL